MQQIIAEIVVNQQGDLIDRFASDVRFRNRVKSLESALNCNHINFQEDLARSLNAQQIAAIVQYFTKLDKLFQYMRRKSVSAIPFLLSLLKELQPELYKENMAWVFAHRHPDSLWIPTGSYSTTSTWNDQNAT